MDVLFANLKNFKREKSSIDFREFFINFGREKGEEKSSVQRDDFVLF